MLYLFLRCKTTAVVILSGGSKYRLLPNTGQLLLEEEVIPLPEGSIRRSRERSI